MAEKEVGGLLWVETDRVAVGMVVGEGDGYCDRGRRGLRVDREGSGGRSSEWVGKEWEEVMRNMDNFFKNIYILYIW